MHRRKFLSSSTFGAAIILSPRLQAANAATKSVPPPGGPALRFDEWLAARHKQVIVAANLEAFLQPPPNNQWAKFDTELESTKQS